MLGGKINDCTDLITMWFLLLNLETSSVITPGVGVWWRPTQASKILNFKDLTHKNALKSAVVPSSSLET